MNSNELIEKFTTFFERAGFILYPASQTFIPQDDSVMFVNAGMNQFKNIFCKRMLPEEDKVISIQKCIRVGGKHNDLENVGYTSRHLTYFEMLGFFLFKEEKPVEYAIEIVWKFLTKELKISKKKLWITVYKNDKLTKEIWERHVPADRIISMDEESNFWRMGSTGPCGACTEILFDRGKKFGPASHPGEDFAGERFLELWNLVIMMYNQTEAGLEGMNSIMIDTGAGLERISMILQKRENIFGIDRFRKIVKGMSKLFAIKENNENRHVFNVVSDHLSCASIVISDGILPGNTDRGFVLRKILRRAFRVFSKMFNVQNVSLYKVMPEVVDAINSYVPCRILNEKTFDIMKEVQAEEEKFFYTKDRNALVFQSVIARIKGNTIDARTAFILKDTHGIDFDDIKMLANEQGMTVNEEEFFKLCLVSSQRNRNKSLMASGLRIDSELLLCSKFIGFDVFECVSDILKITDLHGTEMDCLKSNLEGFLITRETPFYPEQAGQSSDKGFIEIQGVKHTVINVLKKGDTILHRVLSSEDISHSSCFMSIDIEYRMAVSRAHTATHILQNILRNRVSKNIVQAGSSIKDDILRFDFAFNRPVTKDELLLIESDFNNRILQNDVGEISQVPLSSLKTREDIIMLFEGKYEEVARLVSFGNSKELCCGAHCNSTSEIGVFKILCEKSSSSGIRRIEAITGVRAFKYYQETSSDIIALTKVLNLTKCSYVVAKVTSLKEKQKTIISENRALFQENASFRAQNIYRKLKEDGKGVIFEFVKDTVLVRAVTVSLCNMLKEYSKCFGISIVNYDRDTSIINASILYQGDRDLRKILTESDINVKVLESHLYVVGKVNLENFVDILRNVMYN